MIYKIDIQVLNFLSRSTEETGRFEPKSTTQRQANTMIFRFYFVKQINGDGAENVVGDRKDRETATGDRRMRIQRDEMRNVVGDRQDREAGTEDRRTRIQKDEAGNVVGDRQDRETGTEDRRTRIQKDEAGNVVGNRQDRETGNRRQANCWRDLHEPNSEDNLAPGEQCISAASLQTEAQSSQKHNKPLQEQFCSCSHYMNKLLQRH
jgi:uncharacterized protein YjbJ (UPF0337 family)